MEALDEIRESGIDYCSCPEQCPHHGKCWECVLIHRGHRDHLPYCMWAMINERLYSLQRLTEGSLMKWKKNENVSIPSRNGYAPNYAEGEEYRQVA